MTRKFHMNFLVAVATLSTIFMLGCQAPKEEAVEEPEMTGIELPEAYEKADIKHGALLYDKWYKVKGVETEEDHPLYPEAGKKKGADSWRCKECHGWDYIGKDGRYSKGSHYTGIKGVFEARTKSPDDLYDAIVAQKHGFAEHFAEGDVWALVKFIREGLIDINTVLNPDNSAKGDPAKGKTIYAANCGSCHGDDGDKIDFNEDEEGVQGVGDYASGNPQEIIHKIRWGHPGSEMPSGVVDQKLSDTDTIDVLTYSQALK